MDVTIRLLMTSVVTVATIVTPLASTAPPALSLDELLAAPVSAGTIALLGKYRTDARILPVMKTALSDSRPQVRRAAGRVIATSALANLAGDVLIALRDERDPETAAEFANAVIINTNGDSDDDVLRLTKATSSEIHRRAIVRIAWVRPQRVIDHLDDLIRDERGIYDRQALAVATRDGTSLQPIARRALTESNLELWRGVLDTVDWNTRRLDPEIMRLAMTAEPATIRSLLIWEVLTKRPSTVPSAEALTELRRNVAAMAVETAQSPAGRDLDAALALALLQRYLGTSGASSKIVLDAFAQPGAMTGDHYIERLFLKNKLTSSERRVLEQRANRLGADWSLTLKYGETERQPPSAVPDVPFRLIAGFPNGFVEDVLHVAQCQRGDGGLIATVRYDRRGSLASASLPQVGSVPSCAAAFGALVRAMFQDDRQPSAMQEEVAMLLLPEALSCLSEDEPIAAAIAYRTSDESTVAPPKKIKDVKPVYPSGAVNLLQDGLVTIEADITSSGCVRGMRLVGAVAASLNTAALLAVSQWRYTPARLNGVTVPVRMTLTVQFMLR